MYGATLWEINLRRRRRDINRGRQPLGGPSRKHNGLVVLALAVTWPHSVTGRTCKILKYRQINLRHKSIIILSIKTWYKLVYNMNIPMIFAHLWWVYNLLRTSEKELKVGPMLMSWNVYKHFFVCTWIVQLNEVIRTNTDFSNKTN